MRLLSEFIAQSSASQGRRHRFISIMMGGLFALVITITSAPAQYRFDYWTTGNGLPQNTIRRLVQPRDGFRWLTTFDRLVRFEGVRFTVFDKGNTHGLRSNRFTTLT